MTATDPSSADLAARLLVLERAHRRLRLLVLGLLLALVALVWLWIPPLPVRTVVAETFVVRDANGGRRAVLGVNGRGTGAEFTLHDGSGRLRLRMATDGSGSPRIALFDGKGRRRTALRLAGDGSPHFELYDPSGASGGDQSGDQGASGSGDKPNLELGVWRSRPYFRVWPERGAGVELLHHPEREPAWSWQHIDPRESALDSAEAGDDAQPSTDQP